MPSWRVHRHFGKALGFDRGLMRSVDAMLDFPEVLGLKLNHKAVHNLAGILEAYARHGLRGAEYAILHLWLDEQLRGKPGRLLDTLLKICSDEHLRGAGKARKQAVRCKPSGNIRIFWREGFERG
jgi:hypothetical protein